MTDTNIQKRVNRQRRHARIRAKISGTAERPRITVFKSNAHVYVQAVDDRTGTTIAAINDDKVKKGTKTERAAAAGTLLAKALQAKKITMVVFDVSGFKYHGRIKAVADALRSAGIRV